MNTVSIGDVIGGRYRIEALLGHGGMAVVYQARHTATGKQCALKLVHAHLVARPQLLDLFVREAQVGARVGANPHIVDVFDAGADEARHVPFLAMELVHGQDLERYLAKNGAMPHALVRIVAAQLADALDQAHRAGVVHRDLKPSNLILAADRHGQPLLKVMDFGIAKILEQEAQRTATQVGTPAYSAPEQMGPTLRKLAERQGITIATGVSAATDVWAMGLIAYDLFTAWPPGQFWGVEALTELPTKIVLEVPEAPSLRAGVRASLLPAGFDAWFAQCTRRDAAQRWQSAGQAAAELIRLLDGAAGLGHFAPPSAPVLAAGAEAKGATLFGEPVQEALEYAPGATEVFDAVIAAPAIEMGAPVAAPVIAPWTNAQPNPAGHAQPTGAGVGRTTGAGGGRSTGTVVALVAATFGLAAALVVGGVAGFNAYGASAAKRACAADGKRCNEACDLDDFASCVKLGVERERGVGGAKDEASAVKLYTRACDGGDLGGCAALGAMYASGRGIAKDPVKATSLFATACNGQNLRGCGELARMYEAGLGGVPKDEARAAALYQKACAGNEIGACGRLGAFYLGGRGGLATDDGRALELLRKACDAGELRACGDLGVLYEAGRGVPAKDEPLAATHYRKACDGGDAASCGRLGAMLEAGRGLAKDEAQAATLYQSACDRGEATACHGLAVLHENGRGGLAKDEAQAAALYMRACDGGELRGCGALAWLYERGRGGLPKDDRRAVALYQRACDGGNMAGCNNTGVMYQAGRGGLAKDEQRAAELYRLACEGGSPNACSSLGQYMCEGRVVPKDKTRGIELLRKGCAGGNQWGCDRLKEATARP